MSSFSRFGEQTSPMWGRAMKVRSVGHACLEIEVAGLRIVTDPWWAGPAYNQQWYPWPTPRPDGLEDRPIDYVYLSHGHEDHLHPDTLKRLRPGSVALVPECLTGGMTEFLREGLGFSDVIELQHGRTATLRNGVKVTCYLNLTDSLLVVEGDGQVLVDGNDALHASPPAVIEHFCHALRARHPPVDLLFLGYGGASWFPNCIRLPGREDREVARARERVFVENFLAVVQRLRPRLACPFAASFVLLEPHNRWINDVKLEVPTPDEVHRALGVPSDTRCHLLLPGDVIDGIQVTPGGAQRPTPERLRAAYADVLRHGCTRVENLVPLSRPELDGLAEALNERLTAHASRLGKTPVSIELRLRDNPGQAIALRLDRRRPEARLAETGALPLAIELRAELLRAALDQDYGTEAWVIGYGAVVHLSHPGEYRPVLALLSALCPREATWRRVVGQATRAPGAVLGSLWRQRWPLAAYLGTRVGLLPHSYQLEKLARPERAPAASAA